MDDEYTDTTMDLDAPSGDFDTVDTSTDVSDAEDFDGGDASADMDESIVDDTENFDDTDDSINEEDESLVEDEEAPEENEEIDEEDESLVEDEEAPEENEEIDEEDESLVEDEEAPEEDEEIDEEDESLVEDEEVPEEDEEIDEEDESLVEDEEAPEEDEEIDFKEQKADEAGFLFGKRKKITEQPKYEEEVKEDISPENDFLNSLREKNANIDSKNDEELKKIATEETFSPKKFEHGDGERIRGRETDPRYIQDTIIESNKDDMQTFTQIESDDSRAQEFEENKNNMYINDVENFKNINMNIYEECVKTETELEYNSGDRKEELDATRCTYAQEFRNQAEKAKSMENKLQSQMHQIENDETQIDLYNKYKSTIENLQKEYEFCDCQANRLMQDVETKTEFAGVNGMNLSQIDSKFIKEQGNEVEHFKGTCGECSIANGINALGGDLTEKQVVEYARNNKICESENYADNEYDNMEYMKKIEVEGTNGATNVADRRKIVNGLGYNFEVRYDESLDDIYRQMQKGKSPIMTVNADVLDKRVSQVAPYTDENGITTEIPVKKEFENLRAVRKYAGINHAVTVKGIQLNDNGEAVGIWLHDTGNNSSTGNSCYITKDEYKKIIAAMPQSVEYISRRN